jgi:hypothetical protein
MIQQILSLLYLLFFLAIVVAALFVVYHISKYSLSKKNAFWGNMIFLSGLAILLGLNAIIFFRINWDSIVFEPQMTQRSVW